MGLFLGQSQYDTRICYPVHSYILGLGIAAVNTNESRPVGGIEVNGIFYGVDCNTHLIELSDIFKGELSTSCKPVPS